MKTNRPSHSCLKGREKNTGLFLWRGLASLMMLVFVFQLQSAKAQIANAFGGTYKLSGDLVSPCTNCVAEDIKAVDFWFKGYGPNDNPKCYDSSTVLDTDTLIVQLNVTAKERYGLLITANLHVDSAGSESNPATTYFATIINCTNKTYKQGIVYDTIAVNWGGRKIRAGFYTTMREVFVAWDNNKPNGPKKTWMVCEGLNTVGGTYTSASYDCKMWGDGVSLTPKCKKQTEVFVIKSKVNPKTYAKNITKTTCAGGSDGSIEVYSTPWFQSPVSYSWTGPNSYTGSGAEIDGLKAGTYTVTATFGTCTGTASFVVGSNSAITFSKGQENIKCKEQTTSGKAWIENIAGGVLGEDEEYSISWSTGSDNDTIYALAAGKYYVTVTDGLSCSKTDSITITAPALALTVDTVIVKDSVRCAADQNGKAYVKVKSTSGTPYKVGAKYRYVWSKTRNLADTVSTTDTASGLSARKYYVQVKDSLGCTKLDSITVPAKSNLSISVEADAEEICQGSTTTITVTAADGFEFKSPAYRYYLSTTGLPANAAAITGKSGTFEEIAGGKYYTAVRDSLNCTAVDSITITEVVCQTFCTYTQGYFGNEGGKSSYNNDGNCVDGSSTIDAINASLAWWTSKYGGLKVGNIDVVAKGASEILTYLPGGGPSRVWPYDYFPSPDAKQKNTLLSQLLTLGLNIGLNQHLDSFILPEHLYVQHTHGACDDEDDSYDDDDESSDGSCHSYDIPEQFAGKSVKEIFEAASDALKSSSASDATRTSYAGIAGLINEAFDECGRSVPESLCGDVEDGEEEGGEYGSVMNNNSSAEMKQLFKLSAYPNPFSSKVTFSFKAPISGNAVVEILDASGRRLEQINKGQVVAGQMNTVEYKANRATPSQLMYRITVGKYSVIGKLVNVKQ